ncbi:hypothetical protein D9M69_677960 [compost metagenome]
MFQVIDESQQVAGVATQPIQLPDHDFVTVPQVLKHFVQFRSTGPRSAYAVVGEDPLAARGMQRCMLQIRVLVHGADPGIAETPHTCPIAHQRLSGLLLRIAYVRHIDGTRWGLGEWRKSRL